jgi:hypothetical protein
MDGKRTLRGIVDAVLADMKAKGIDVLSPRPVGDYAAFRGLELGAAINRLRTLTVQMELAIPRQIRDEPKTTG